MAALLRRIIRRFKGEKEEEQDKPAVELQTCSSSFDEHHLYLRQIAQRYPDSNINVAHMNSSLGIRVLWHTIMGCFAQEN